MPVRSLCIHGHFYQPPREDPLTGIIPDEAGAAPYKNWNERILAECYRPNAELGNFERISFNIGPTLFEWMARYDPQVCRLIAAQDRANLERFGVGNAMAQAYNHTILPLASYEDKVTQVVWGIAEFQHRFGHKPAGMWLPETAVDLETLSVLADQGIEYTILAPWQAEERQIDPTEPYRIHLPEGKSITAFFYEQELSTAVSFAPSLTTNADSFARQAVANRFSQQKEQQGEPQILLIASDGELYGHHQQFRDRFLAHLVNGASHAAGYDVTFPGAWLKFHPARRSASLRGMTSWSCMHGLKRWNGACDCTTIGDGNWKHSLRLAFDRLASAIDAHYLDEVQRIGIDGWQLRHQYIHVMLGEQSLEDSASRLADRKLETDTLTRLGYLMEAQRERQRMFTSCAWFFGDLNRLEPRYNINHAAQAVRLMQRATGTNLTSQFLADLARVTDHSTGFRGDTVLGEAFSGAA